MLTSLMVENQEACFQTRLFINGLSPVMSFNQRVPVLSLTGKPLMPTKASRARRMLKDNKAKIVQNDLGIFAIQLTHKTESEETQQISVGVDPGSHFTGIAAQSKLFTHCGFNLDLPGEKITKRIEERSTLRRARRGRRIKRTIPFKLRNHRQVRFNNRSGLEIAPSIKASKQLELRIISEISKLLPITHVIIEKITTSKSRGFTWAQQGNNWLIKQLIIRFPFLEVSELKGHQTSNLRNHLGLSKSKDKGARDPSAHVNDAITLSSYIFVSYQKSNFDNSADFVGTVNLTEFYFKCVNRISSRPHKLHVIQPIKNGIRRSYGGSNKVHSFNNGDLVRYKTSRKDLVGYVQSNDLYNYIGGKWMRIKQLTSNKNLNIIRNTCNLILS